MIKNLPANAGNVRDVGLIPGSGRSSGGGMATHSSMLAWRIPWAEEPARLWSTESQSWTQLKRLSIKLTPKKDVLFIIGDWNAKVGS